MIVSLLDRFRRIERPPKRERQPPPPGSGAELDRFGPEPPPRLELLDAGAGERPFTRCMRCGMDHHIFATECTGCGASLDTAAQHEFNARLWSKRQEDAARETCAAGERQARQAQADAELSAARRAMGEALAREVGEHERRRLEIGRWRGRIEVSGMLLLDLLAWLWRLLVRRG